MRRNTKPHKFQPFVERLEERQLLAGNVTAAVIGGALVATGDNAGNIIAIEQIDADSYRVRGTATNVNTTAGAKQFDGVVNGIFVDLRGGNDILTLRNLTVPGQTSGVGLGILMGDGIDVLTLAGVTVRDGTCLIDTGTGVDSTVIDSCRFNAGLGVSTGAGNDALAFSRSTVHGALGILMGDGTNALTLLDVKVLNDSQLPNVFGGYVGDSPVGGILTTLSNNFSDIYIDCGAIIEGGTGVDAFVLTKVQIDCLTEIDTAGGIDSVAIALSRFGDRLLDNDHEYAANDVQFESTGLCIETSVGSDAVAIVSTTVYGHLQIDTSGQFPCEVEPSALAPPRTPTADGNDSVALTKVDVLAALIEVPYEHGGDGIVAFQSGFLSIHTGNGIDAVALAFVKTDGTAFIGTTDRGDSTLDGTDVVVITNSNFNRGSPVVPVSVATIGPTGLDIFTGRGNDVVTIARVNVEGSVEVETGEGTDTVSISALAADAIYADLGGGNRDLLAISLSRAFFASFNGGGGTGDILTRVSNSFGSQVVTGFEFVV